MGVLSGYIDAGPGLQFLQYRDDPFQHGTDTTAGEQTIIDNRFVWTEFDNGSINIGNGDEVIGAVVAESPTPEPSTVASLSLGMFGTMCLAIRRRKKVAV